MEVVWKDNIVPYAMPETIRTDLVAFTNSHLMINIVFYVQRCRFENPVAQIT